MDKLDKNPQILADVSNFIIHNVGLFPSVYSQPQNVPYPKSRVAGALSQTPHTVAELIVLPTRQR